MKLVFCSKDGDKTDRIQFTLHKNKLGFREKKKEEEKRGEDQGARRGSSVLLRIFSMCFIPSKYVSFHNVWFIRPHSDHVIFSEISFLKLKD